MQRFRAAIGSEDKKRGSKIIDDITKFAQGLDASVTGPEGTQIAVVLMKMVGHPEDDAKMMAPSRAQFRRVVTD